MKATSALQEECASRARDASSPCDSAVSPAAPPSVHASPGVPAGRELSEQEVEQVLALSASEAGRRPLDDADDEYDGGRESDYPHILGRRSGNARVAASRTPDGGLHDDDALRVAEGVLFGLVIACSLWSVAMLLLVGL